MNVLRTFATSLLNQLGRSNTPHSSRRMLSSSAGAGGRVPFSADFFMRQVKFHCTLLINFGSPRCSDILIQG